MDNRPIGIFDSGIGGISVLHEAIKKMPKEHYIYYADTKHVPYGLKTTQQIKQYVDESIEFLIKQNAKTIIVACNTATSVDIDSLREKNTIPMIGMEPAVKPALEIEKNRRILLLATPVTIKEKKLRKLLDQYDTNKRVDLVPMPKLVEFAEQEEFETEEVITYLKQELSPYNLEEYGTVVLGCTHFIYFRNTIRNLFPDDIVLVDGNGGTVRRLEEILKNNDILSDGLMPRIEYFYSGEKVTDKDQLEKIKKLHHRLEEIERT